jgi:hypothetical protein
VESTADFLQLSRLFLAHSVFLEAAVPTILHLLTNGSQPHHVDVVSKCFGCCCCNAPDWPGAADALLARYACGHRLNLAAPDQLHALTRMLNASCR